jgi:hypothetical protein
LHLKIHLRPKKHSQQPPKNIKYNGPKPTLKNPWTPIVGGNPSKSDYITPDVIAPDHADKQPPIQDPDKKKRRKTNKRNKKKPTTEFHYSTKHN